MFEDCATGIFNSEMCLLNLRMILSSTYNILHPSSSDMDGQSSHPVYVLFTVLTLVLFRCIITTGWHWPGIYVLFTVLILVLFRCILTTEWHWPGIYPNKTSSGHPRSKVLYVRLVIYYNLPTQLLLFFSYITRKPLMLTKEKQFRNDINLSTHYTT